MDQNTSVLEYKCPCCNATLPFHGEAQQMKCEYCDNVFDLDTVKACAEDSSIQDSVKVEWESVTQDNWSQEDQDCIYVHAVQFNESYRPHCSGDFMVTVSTENAPKRIISLPKEEPVDYEYVDGAVKFKIKDLKCFLAYQIIL